MKTELEDCRGRAKRELEQVEQAPKWPNCQVEHGPNNIQINTACRFDTRLNVTLYTNNLAAKNAKAMWKYRECSARFCPVRAQSSEPYQACYTPLVVGIVSPPECSNPLSQRTIRRNPATCRSNPFGINTTSRRNPGHRGRHLGIPQRLQGHAGHARISRCYKVRSFTSPAP